MPTRNLLPDFKKSYQWALTFSSLMALSSGVAEAACGPIETSGGAGNLTVITCTDQTAGLGQGGALSSTDITLVTGATIDDGDIGTAGAVNLGANNLFTVNGDILSATHVGILMSGSNRITVNGQVIAGTDTASTGISGTTNETVIVNAGGAVISRGAGLNSAISLGSGSVVTNFGTISNEGGGRAIVITDGGATVSNYGSIIGNVQLTGGNNTFERATGSSLSAGSVVSADGGGNLLRLNGAGSDSFDAGDIGANGTFRGFDRFEKNGTGTWIVTGTGNQDWTIRQGVLRINGNVSGLMTVLKGGTLGGNGSVGRIDNQGVVAPGASIGTLTLSGDYTQRAGGILEIEISPTAADRLAVGGIANLDGGLRVLPEVGSYVSGTRYPIITAKSVSGTFRTVAVDNPERLGGLGVGVTYLDNEVDLELGPLLFGSSRQQEESVKAVTPVIARQFSRVVTTSIGNHILERLFPLYRFNRSGKTRRDQAPIKHDSDDQPSSYFPRPSGLAGGDAVADDWTLEGLSVWADGGVTWLDNPQTPNRYNGFSETAILGLDYRLEDKLVAGITVAPNQTELNLKSVGGNRSVIGAMVTAYAGYKFDETYAVSGLLGYGPHFNFGRQPVSGEWVKDNNRSDRVIAQVSGSAEYRVNDEARVIPSVSYTHALEYFGSHRSSDGATISLPAVRLGTVKVGAQFDYAVTPEFVPFVNAGIERDLVNSSGAGGRTGFAIGGGVQAPIADSLTLGVAATANLGRVDQSEVQLAANLRYSW